MFSRALSSLLDALWRLVRVLSGAGHRVPDADVTPALVVVPVAPLWDDDNISFVRSRRRGGRTSRPQQIHRHPRIAVLRVSFLDFADGVVVILFDGVNLDAFEEDLGLPMWLGLRQFPEVGGTQGGGGNTRIQEAIATNDLTSSHSTTTPSAPPSSPGASPKTRNNRGQNNQHRQHVPDARALSALPSGHTARFLASDLLPHLGHGRSIYTCALPTVLNARSLDTRSTPPVINTTNGLSCRGLSRNVF
ncbi:hypothetical protein B0H19DRAFT_1257093 [Mycena capillaripes]|nr:hypothetical protein B0H19DRAFT_1257093 [Mycena capillaripes]